MAVTKDNITTSFSTLFGISIFISYRSSLDFSLGIATFGIITLGAAITYYANMMPPLMAEQPPEYKKPEIRQADIKEKYFEEKPTNTPTFTFTYTFAFTPAYTATYTPIIFISQVATSIPTKQTKETQI